MGRTRRVVCVVLGAALLVTAAPFVASLISGAYPLRSGLAAILLIGCGGLLAASGIYPKIMDRY